MHRLELYRIKNKKEFENLHEIWDVLWESRDKKTIFSTYEWSHAAWLWRENTASLYILLFMSGSKHVGLIPLISCDYTMYGTKVKVLEILSVPDNQICEALVVPGYEDSVVKALVNYLLKNKSSWDLINLRKLCPDDFLMERCLSGMKGVLSTGNYDELDCVPTIFLDKSWDDFYKTKSRRMKKSNNNIRNRLHKNFREVKIMHYCSRYHQQHDLQHAYSEYLNVARNSWKNEKLKALYSSNALDFLDRITQYAIKKGWLSIWLLYLDSTPVAGEYQLIDRGRVYALRSEYHKSYSDYSPGSYLNWKILEKSFGLGYITYEMGPGDMEYKIRWSEINSKRYRSRIYGNSLRGRYLRAVEQVLKPTLKKFLK